jgi:hypothetical protein
MRACHWSYKVKVKSSAYIQTLFLRWISSWSLLGISLVNILYHPHFSRRNAYDFLIFSRRAKNQVHDILLDLIVLIMGISVEEYKLWRISLSGFLRPSVNYYIVSPHSRLSTSFQSTYSAWLLFHQIINDTILQIQFMEESKFSQSCVLVIYFFNVSNGKYKFSYIHFLLLTSILAAN